MKAVRTLAWLVAAVIALSLAGCAGSGSAAEVGVHRWQPGHRPVAPRVSGTTLTGMPYDAGSAAAGKVLVINFWAEWCAPCRDEAPVLDQLARETGGQGVRFLGVDVRDERANARAFVRRFGVSYPSLFDPAGKTLLSFREPALPPAPPTTVVIDRRGGVAAMIVGGVRFDTLRDIVRAVAVESV